jgi:formate dehydrogenase subunit gamma
MQTAEVIHAGVAMLFIAAMMGHIYIGSIGMEGAFEAMGEGTVDLNWAKQHHSLWLEEEVIRSANDPKAQTRAAATPAE